MQQVFAQKIISYGKVLGQNDPADLFTKYLDCNTIGRHLKTLKCEFTPGRADEALKLHNISLSIDEYKMMGAAKLWEWTNIILCVVEHGSSKIQKFNCGNICKGELNTLSRRNGSRCSRGSIGQYRGPTA